MQKVKLFEQLIDNVTAFRFDMLVCVKNSRFRDCLRNTYPSSNQHLAPPGQLMQYLVPWLQNTMKYQCCQAAHICKCLEGWLLFCVLKEMLIDSL